MSADTPAPSASEIPPTPKPRHKLVRHCGPGRPPIKGEMSRTDLLIILERKIKSAKTPIQYIAGIARVMAQLRGWIGPGDSEEAGSGQTVKLDEMMRQWAAETTAPNSAESNMSHDRPVDNTTIAKW